MTCLHTYSCDVTHCDRIVVSEDPALPDGWTVMWEWPEPGRLVARHACRRHSDLEKYIGVRTRTRRIIERAIRLGPEDSDQEVAEFVGCSTNAVARVRRFNEWRTR